MPLCGVQTCEVGEMYEHDAASPKKSAASSHSAALLRHAYASLDDSQSCLSLSMRNMMARRYKGVGWEGSGSWMEPSNKAT